MSSPGYVYCSRPSTSPSLLHPPSTLRIWTDFLALICHTTQPSTPRHMDLFYYFYIFLPTMLTNSQCIAILVWGISRNSPPDYSSASKAFEFLTSRAPLTSGVCPLCHQPHGTSYWVSRLFFKRRISFMELENGISTLTSNLLPVDILAESRFINFSHLDHFLMAVQNA